MKRAVLALFLVACGGPPNTTKTSSGFDPGVHATCLKTIHARMACTEALVPMIHEVTGLCIDAADGCDAECFSKQGYRALSSADALSQCRGRARLPVLTEEP